jgi:D-3-phosphoglycerate dehydrogenase
MTDTIENLILELLEWVGRKERTYQETMDAWRTSCPRLPAWEDAHDRRLVEIARQNARSLVRLTPAGLALLKEQRPRSYAELPLVRQQQQGGKSADLEGNSQSPYPFSAVSF